MGRLREVLVGGNWRGGEWTEEAGAFENGITVKFLSRGSTTTRFPRTIIQKANE